MLGTDTLDAGAGPAVDTEKEEAPVIQRKRLKKRVLSDSEDDDEFSTRTESPAKRVKGNEDEADTIPTVATNNNQSETRNKVKTADANSDSDAETTQEKPKEKSSNEFFSDDEWQPTVKKQSKPTQSTSEKAKNSEKDSGSEADGPKSKEKATKKAAIFFSDDEGDGEKKSSKTQQTSEKEKEKKSGSESESDGEKAATKKKGKRKKESAMFFSDEEKEGGKTSSEEEEEEDEGPKDKKRRRRKGKEGSEGSGNESGTTEGGAKRPKRETKKEKEKRLIEQQKLIRASGVLPVRKPKQASVSSLLDKLRQKTSTTQQTAATANRATPSFLLQTKLSADKREFLIPGVGGDTQKPKAEEEKKKAQNGETTAPKPSISTKLAGDQKAAAENINHAKETAKDMPKASTTQQTGTPGLDIHSLASRLARPSNDTDDLMIVDNRPANRKNVLKQIEARAMLDSMRKKKEQEKEREMIMKSLYGDEVEGEEEEVMMEDGEEGEEEEEEEEEGEEGEEEEGEGEEEGEEEEEEEGDGEGEEEEEDEILVGEKTSKGKESVAREKKEEEGEGVAAAKEEKEGEASAENTTQVNPPTQKPSESGTEKVDDTDTTATQQHDDEPSQPLRREDSSSQSLHFDLGGSPNDDSHEDNDHLGGTPQLFTPFPSSNRPRAAYKPTQSGRIPEPLGETQDLDEYSQIGNSACNSWSFNQSQSQMDDSSQIFDSNGFIRERTSPKRPPVIQTYGRKKAADLLADPLDDSQPETQPKFVRSQVDAFNMDGFSLSGAIGFLSGQNFAGSNPEIGSDPLSHQTVATMPISDSLTQTSDGFPPTPKENTQPKTTENEETVKPSTEDEPQNTEEAANKEPVNEFVPFSGRATRSKEKPENKNTENSAPAPTPVPAPAQNTQTTTKNNNAKPENENEKTQKTQAPSIEKTENDAGKDEQPEPPVAAKKLKKSKMFFSDEESEGEDGKVESVNESDEEDVVFEDIGENVDSPSKKKKILERQREAEGNLIEDEAEVSGSESEDEDELQEGDEEMMIGDDEVSEGEEEAAEKAHRKQMEEDERRAIEALKEGVMGGGFRRKMAAGALEDESEALLAAWKRQNRVRGPDDSSDEEGFAVGGVGGADSDDEEVDDKVAVKLDKLNFLNENSQNSNLMALLEDETSQSFHRHVRVQSRLAPPAAQKSKVPASDFCAPALVRSTSSKGSFLGKSTATLMKIMPPVQKQASRSSFVFATMSRDGTDSKDGTSNQENKTAKRAPTKAAPRPAVAKPAQATLKTNNSGLTGSLFAELNKSKFTIKKA
eukprot:comp23174_c0_seq1/m.37530 comp23174_c0_seq1/g.37530  ORF comp23174_c0_seq1/g.37530 comp23174_c0_seq1/m.37530 type:complete len:1295 (-) comp23174_c0_seq1:284-4168(-)